MSKNIQIYRQADKKIDKHIDRGDSFTNNVTEKLKKKNTDKELGRGDSVSNLNVKKSSPQNEKKIEQKGKTNGSSNITTVANDTNYKNALNLIKEKYNLVGRVKNGSKREDTQNKIGGVAGTDDKNEHFPNQNNDAARGKQSSSDESSTKPSEETTKTATHVQRRPIIRTITSKNDTKIYKAVTFVDKKRAPTSLEISMPTMKRITNKITDARSQKKEKAGVKEKGNPKQKVQKLKNTSREELRKKISSPQTEVAKWAPRSVNRHTKPYYEAWINTTLAAICVNTNMDKGILEKKSLVQSLQKALEEVPDELYYDKVADEKYTGRIKVRHK